MSSSYSSCTSNLIELQIANIDLKIQCLYSQLSADRSRPSPFPGSPLKVEDYELISLTSQRYCIICSKQYCTKTKHKRINMLFQSCKLIKIHNLAQDTRKECMLSKDFSKKILSECPDNPKQASIYLQIALGREIQKDHCCIIL